MRPDLTKQATFWRSWVAQFRASIGPIDWQRLIIVGILVLAAAAAAIWYSRSVLPRQFSDHLSALIASHNLNVEYDEFYIEWGRAVIHTGDVTVRQSDGSPILRAPHLEIDFSVRRLINGWSDAIYQVYTHRPTLYAQQNKDGTWNLGNWFSALPTQSDLNTQQAFHLARVYADVLTIELTTREGRQVIIDNGVATVGNLRWPLGSKTMPITLHGRVNGGKLTAELALCGMTECETSPSAEGEHFITFEALNDGEAEHVVRSWLQ